MEYVFGFLVGAITMYIAYKPQFKQFDEVLKGINEKLEQIQSGSHHRPK